jgi:signal transduction histidine kinase
VGNASTSAEQFRALLPSSIPTGKNPKVKLNKKVRELLGSMAPAAARARLEGGESVEDFLAHARRVASDLTLLHGVPFARIKKALLLDFQATEDFVAQIQALLPPAAVLQANASGLLAAENAELQRIGRILHDGPAQALAVVRLQLGLLERSSVEAEQAINEMQEMVDQAIQCVRRAVNEVNRLTSTPEDLSLGLQQLVARVGAQFPDVAVRLKCEKIMALDPAVELTILRAAKECLDNATQHAQASLITVSLAEQHGHVRLSVQDDGLGFAVEEGLAKRRAFGLAGLQKRVTSLGGTLAIESFPREKSISRTTNSSGTVINMLLPIYKLGLKSVLG